MPRLCLVCCYSVSLEGSATLRVRLGKADDGNAGSKPRSELCRTSCPDPACGPRGNDRRARLAAGPAASDRRQPVSQPVVARRLPRHARHGASCGSRCTGGGRTCRALSPAILQETIGRGDRPPHRAGEPTPAHACAGADRPAKRPGKRLRGCALARASAAHGGKPWRAWRRHAAHPRAGARPVGFSRCRGAAPGDSLCFLVRTSRRSPHRRVPGAYVAGHRAAAHRRLGDAARLYRQAAGLPHRRHQPADDSLCRSGKQRPCLARDRWLGRGDAGLHRQRRHDARHDARRRRSRSRQAGACRRNLDGAAVPRQADGRWNPVAAIGRPRTGDMVVCRDAGQPAGDPLLRRA